MIPLAFRVLGPLEATVDGQQVRLTGRRERALLGVLLLNAGKVVSIEQLIDGVWGGPAPRSARHMVYEYVLRVRVALGDATLISTRAPGYMVAPAVGELDAGSFDGTRPGGAPRACGMRSEAALRSFDEALGLWRGDALCDVALEGNARAAADSLDDQRRTVAAERVDVALALGRHHELIPGLERAVATAPLDERARGQLMLALYRNGQQTEALERYRSGRRRLVDEVGVEPGNDLRALEQAILCQDPSLALETPAVRREPSVAHEPADAHSVPATRSRSGIAAAVFASPRLDRNGHRGRCDARCRCGRARQRGRGRDRGRGTRSAAWVDPDRLTSRRDCLRLEVGVGLRPRLVVTLSNLTVLASRDRNGAAAPSRAEPGRGRRTTLGDRRGARGYRLAVERINPTFDSASHVTRVPMVVAGDSELTRRAWGYRGRRAALGTADADRRTRWAHARPYGHQRSAECHRRRVRQHVARLSRSERASPHRRRRHTTRIPVGRGPSAVAVGENAVWVADALDDTVKPIDPATNSVITTIPVAARQRDPHRRRKRMGGERRRRHTDPDRPAPRTRHRDGEGRR